MSTPPPRSRVRRLVFVARVLRIGLLAAVIGWAIARIRRHFPPPAERIPSETATEDTTVTTMVAVSADAGYAYEFVVQSDTRIRCSNCQGLRHASEYSMDALRRMEGASDPDDTIAVIGVRCPACSAQGTMVLNYGPSGSPEEGDVLLAVHDNRVHSAVTTGTAPGEVRTR
jgi:hypothetical protein